MRRPLWSLPTALIKDTECPNILACAPKLEAAPPRCSVSSNTSHNTSPMLIMFMISSPTFHRARHVEKSQDSKLEIRNSKTEVGIEFDFRFSSFDLTSVGAEILCWFSERCNRPRKSLSSPEILSFHFGHPFVIPVSSLARGDRSVSNHRRLRGDGTRTMSRAKTRAGRLINLWRLPIARTDSD